MAQVNKIAEKESTGFGRRHYRPVYVMHKWWARRLGSIFRAILLYSLADESLEKWNQDPKELWNHYSSDVDFQGKVVLDPMMGGGTTVIEALRLGCNVIAGDINPVAWFVVKKQIEDTNLYDIEDAMKQLDDKLGTDLRKYYRTVCPHCQGEAEAIYYFHYKELGCPDCDSKIPLMRDFFLAKSPTGNGDVVVCPGCWDVFVTKSSRESTECPKCDTAFIPKNKGFVKGQEFHCAKCGPKKIVSTIRENGRPDERMYAVEYYCSTCDKMRNSRLKNGRGYKAADAQDYSLLEQAREEFVKIEEKLPIPDTKIPLGVETKRALNHGYVRFRDMFNERQLLNLGKIYQWILHIRDWNLKEFLILAFSNSLKYNNMFAKYNSTHGFITDLFRTHSFSPSMAPVEANCYDTSKGRGAFTAFVNLVLEGKQFCQNPFERIFIDGAMRKVPLKSPIFGKIVENYQKMGENGSVLLRCGSSEEIPIPDGTVDAVITDPPYYGNVMYSELSNFFYVWLRIGLQEIYDQFQPEFVPWEGEIIENRVQNKGKEEFLQQLTRVFSESNRVLKDGGVMVFTFHHAKSEAWEALLESVLGSGFYVTAIYPVRSEMKASTHLYDMDNIIYDVVIVCRKKTEELLPVEWSSVKKQISSDTRKTIAYLTKNGESLGILDAYVIGLGRCLEYYSKHYPNVVESGEFVSIEDAMSSIKMLLEDILERESDES
ncbi:MAG: DNA methyltransferase [Candidatus Thorarchaeota archaeon]